MTQPERERGSALREAPSVRASGRVLGSGLRTLLASQLAFGRSGLAAARFATRQRRVPLRAVAGAGLETTPGDVETDRDAGSGREFPDQHGVGNVADASAAAGTAFDAFLETCVPLGHPPHE